MGGAAGTAQVLHTTWMWREACRSTQGYRPYSVHYRPPGLRWERVAFRRNFCGVVLAHDGWQVAVAAASARRSTGRASRYPLRWAATEAANGLRARLTLVARARFLSISRRQTRRRWFLFVGSPLPHGGVAVRRAADVRRGSRVSSPSHASAPIGAVQAASFAEPGQAAGAGVTQPQRSAGKATPCD